MDKADLTELNTFRLPATAEHLLYLNTLEDLACEALGAEDLLILGGGSNTLFLADWPGTVVVNALKGLSANVEDTQVMVRVGAGENWHQLVKHCLDQGWYGLENLIMIPGSVGAAPIQNIGAYGVELASSIHQVTAWDRQAGCFVEFDQSACAFGYRDSFFKHTIPSRFIITEVSFQLSTQFSAHTTYPSLQQALEAKHGSLQCDPKTLAATIMELRSQRLPDPSKIPNVGSFFKNPIVSAETYNNLHKEFPTLPGWAMPEQGHGLQYKLSAAWMIDALGFKGQRIGDAGVYAEHALVLVNLGHATADQLMALARKIKQAVKERFGVELMPEPQIIGQL